MRTLFHLALSPQSRLVRLVFGEKRMEAHLRAEPIWDRREDFLAINPAGEVPVMVEDDGTTIAGATPIAEYLEEVCPEPALLQGDPSERAEIRRLVAWFDRKFDREVTDLLVGEKVLKRFLGIGEPSREAIRAGHANIAIHLDYIGWLADRRTRSEEHTSELQSLMRISYAVFCLKKKKEKDTMMVKNTTRHRTQKS